MGEHVYQITIPKSAWLLLDRYTIYGYDIQALFDHCASKLIDDDPSRTLHYCIYWIDNDELEGTGFELTYRY